MGGDNMIRSPARRLLRGYGPLAALVLVFTLMAALVPTVGDKVRTVTEAASGPAPAADGAFVPSPDIEPGAAPAPGDTPAAANPAATPGGRPAAAGSGPAGAPARGAGPTAGTSRGPGATASGPGTGPGAPCTAKAAAARPGVGPCPDRAKQVPNDPYSPPCVTFSGANPGATSRGVSADKIVVSVRLFDLPEFAKDVEAAESLTMETEALQMTMAGLAEFFNSRFQSSGRRLEFVFHKGRGDIVAEFQGGGQEGAEAGVVKISEEMKAF